MSDPMIAAIIAASAALIVAFVNSIVAEAYRRCRDKKALAAAIAGELASYELAMPILKESLQKTIQAIEQGAKSSLSYRPYDKPRDYVFERSVERLGLLGPEMVENIVYVYGNLNGFRTSLQVISQNFADMPDSEIVIRSKACLDAIDRSVQRGTPLVAALKKVAGT